MLIGSSTSHKLSVVSSAAATTWISGSVIAVSTATPPVVDGSVLNELLFASIGAATQDVIVGAASLIKRLMELSIRNAHATTSTDITVTRTDGVNTPEVIKCTLLAGEKMDYNGAGSWLHYDTNGALYPSVGNAATQADMEAATATNKYVTPLSLNWHPGAAKFWAKATPGGTLNASWNVTSEADATAGVCDITIATDFSSTNYCVVACALLPNTNTTVTDAKNTAIRSATQAAGTVSVQTYDQTATNYVIEDPTSWYVVGFGDQ